MFRPNEEQLNRLKAKKAAVKTNTEEALRRTSPATVVPIGSYNEDAPTIYLSGHEHVVVKQQVKSSYNPKVVSKPGLSKTGRMNVRMKTRRQAESPVHHRSVARHR